jgi:type VI secretion system secreted protein Hcp
MRTGKKCGRLSGRIMKIMLLALAFSLLVASGAYATTTNLFIKFAGIDGESTVASYEGWSAILSVNWGLTMEAPPHSGGGGVGGPPVFEDLIWNQVIDKSFPKLFDRAAKGMQTDTVLVDFTKPGGPSSKPDLTYFQMEFREVVLTTLDLSGKSGEETTFTGSFAYNFIKMTYTEYDALGRVAGRIEASYDLATNLGSPGELGALYAMGLSGPRIAIIPLPPSLVLLGSGLLGLVGWRRKFKGVIS